jgi:NRAMP (natural resistance-associated macrophage protein)-like metal ion transporter
MELTRWNKGLAQCGLHAQEVIGSAIAIQLLTGGRVPLWQGVLITGIDTFFLLFLERLGVRKLEAFFGVLVATMTVSFGVMYSKAHCPTGEVLLGTVLPRIKCALPAESGLRLLSQWGLCVCVLPSSTQPAVQQS